MQDMQEQMPTNDATEGAAPETDAGTEAARTVIEELRLLGERFASAARAAASTPEAEDLKADLQEGLRDVRTGIDRALQSAKSTAGRTQATGRAGDQVRVELAGALRGLNRALERVANSMEREPGQPAETAPDGDETTPPEGQA